MMIPANDEFDRWLASDQWPRQPHGSALRLLGGCVFDSGIVYRRYAPT